MDRKLLSPADLESLDGSPEDRTLELKRQPIETDRLAEIIQAGANGIAPVMHIVIGGAEKDGRFDLSQSQPITYPFQIRKRGETIDSFDAYKRHLAQVVNSHTTGFYEGLFEVREVAFREGTLIVIEVPRSEERPHQNSQSKKYFIKADGKIRPMDDHEISDAITAREHRRHYQKSMRSSAPPIAGDMDTTIDQTTVFPSGLPVIYTNQDLKPGARVAIVDELTGDDRDVRLTGKAALSLRIKPRTISNHWDSTDLRDLIKGSLDDLIPLYAPADCDLDFGRNNHGACVWLVNPQDNQTTYSAVQIYCDGALWAADTLLLSTDEREGEERIRIYGEAVEHALEEALPRYFTFINGILAQGLPYECVVGLSNVQDYRLVGRGIPEYDLSGRILQAGIFDSFAIDKNSIEAARKTPNRIFEHFYQQLWKAAGKRRP